MQVINLTDDSIWISNQLKLEANRIWSGGEIDFRVAVDPLSTDKSCTIFTRLNNSIDVMRLFMAADIFEKNHVVIPYLPYARQDRACRDGEPFSLKVMATLLNSQKFKSVKVFDPHSNVSELLINNMIAVDNRQFVKSALQAMFHEYALDLSNICLVSPDAGALKKVRAVADYVGHPKTLCCLKHRSLENGGIESIYIPEDKLDKSLTYVIIDDICDGGRTFIALTEALRAKGAENVQLIVSHGIFANGTKPLFDCGVQHIYTTNSINPDMTQQTNLFKFDVMGYMR